MHYLHFYDGKFIRTISVFFAIAFYFPVFVVAYDLPKTDYGAYHYIDQSTAATKSNYYIILGSRYGGIGHAYAGFGVEDEDKKLSYEKINGVYPEGVTPTDQVGTKSLVKIIQGRVPIEFVDEKTTGVTLNRIQDLLIVKVDLDKYEKAKSIILEPKSSNVTGDYNLLYNNCIRYVEEVAKKAGISIPSRGVRNLNLTPASFIRQVILLNKLPKEERGAYKDFDSSMYYGPIENGIPVGRGLLINSSGDVYYGQLLKGLFSGNGEFYENNGNRFIGHFEKGAYSKGVLIYNLTVDYKIRYRKLSESPGSIRNFIDGVDLINRYDKFEGELRSSLSGSNREDYTTNKELVFVKGTLSQKAKEPYYQYSGDFRDGVAQGKGVLIKGRIRYEGDFFQDKMEGHGVLEIFPERGHNGGYSDYEASNTIRGLSEYINAEKEYKYIGPVKNNLPEGSGKLYMTGAQEKAIYTGEFNNGQFHGEGVLQLENSRTRILSINGKFKNGNPINGLVHYDNGNSYEGGLSKRFDRGRLEINWHGKGVQKSNWGDDWEAWHGNWVYGEPQGEFICILSTNVIIEAEYQNGRKVGGFKRYSIKKKYGNGSSIRDRVGSNRGSNRGSNVHVISEQDIREILGPEVKRIELPTLNVGGYLRSSLIRE